VPYERKKRQRYDLANLARRIADIVSN